MGSRQKATKSLILRHKLEEKEANILHFLTHVKELRIFFCELLYHV